MNHNIDATAYTYYHDVLPSELLDLIVKEIKSIRSDLFSVGTTSDTDENDPRLLDVRNSSVYWLNDEHWICAIFRHYFEKANRESWEYDLRKIESIQVSKYDLNGHYNWHSDYGSDEDSMTRKLSASLLITDENDYDGGELQLIDYHANIVTVEKKKGSIIIFDSRIPHRVSRVTKGTRISLVSWMRGPKLR